MALIDPRAVLSLLGSQGSPQGAAPQGPQIQANAPPQASQMSTPLAGPGGGIDDLIPAHVQNSDGTASAAALSPGEFVMPAASVAYMGDGDNNFGADMLNALKTDPSLMDKIKPIIRDHLKQQTKTS